MGCPTPPTLSLRLVAERQGPCIRYHSLTSLYKPCICLRKGLGTQHPASGPRKLHTYYTMALVPHTLLTLLLGTTQAHTTRDPPSSHPCLIGAYGFET